MSLSLPSDRKLLIIILVNFAFFLLMNIKGFSLEGATLSCPQLPWLEDMFIISGLSLLITESFMHYLMKSLFLNFD